MSKDPRYGDDVLAFDEVNKYAYSVDGNATDTKANSNDPSIFTFEPLPEKERS